jgi:ABC-type transporter Mla subunit MlaD
MNIKMLNEQQTQWAVRLAAFDFVIKHRLSKTNLTDALSRRSDYVEAISENIDRLLSTLQRKLAAMPATMFKFSQLSVILRQFVKLVKSRLTWGLENLNSVNIYWEN